MSTKLKKVYDAAVAKLGDQLTRALACSFGSVDGTFEDTPAERRDGLAAALNRIMGGGQMTTGQVSALVHGERAAADEPESQDEVFAAIRSRAFKRADADEPEKPAAAVIDPIAIYARWNASKPKTDD